MTLGDDDALGEDEHKQSLHDESSGHLGCGSR